jgi:predicted transcriptional regulator
MNTTTIKLPPDMENRLKAEAKRRSASKSMVVREALELYLTEKRTTARTSCLDAAADLAGTIKGPADLSTHKRHMEGFGT